MGKLPQLKEATPKLIEDVKVTATDYLHSAAEYITSYTVAQVALKVVDTGLDAVSSRSTLQLTLFVSRVSRRPGRRKPRLLRRLPFWAPCSRSLGCTIFSASSGSRLSSWLIWSLSPTPPRRLRK